VESYFRGGAAEARETRQMITRMVFFVIMIYVLGFFAYYGGNVVIEKTVGNNVGLPQVPGVLSYAAAPAQSASTAYMATRIALQSCGLQGFGWGVCIQTSPVRRASVLLGPPRYVLFRDKGCEALARCPGSALGPLPAWIVPMRAGTDPTLRKAYVVVDAQSARVVEIFGTVQRPGRCSLKLLTQLTSVHLQSFCGLFAPNYQFVIGVRVSAS